MAMDPSAGFIGSAIDVTDQKLAQQAPEKVSGQLIEAQEKERSRIAESCTTTFARGWLFCLWSSGRRIEFRICHLRRRTRSWKRSGIIALKLQAMSNPCRISCTH
jgi:hypothetical protein